MNYITDKIAPLIRPYAEKCAELGYPVRYASLFVRENEVYLIFQIEGWAHQTPFRLRTPEDVRAIQRECQERNLEDICSLCQHDEAGNWEQEEIEIDL